MRRVFFSFHHDGGGDVWRANQVRNMWVGSGRDGAGFSDKAEFEEVEKKGDAAIEAWIEQQMKGTSVTVVLIGEHTHARRWVRYEIDQSVEKKNGLIGIHLSSLKDNAGETGVTGPVPRSSVGYPVYGPYSYNQIKDNIGKWVENAAQEEE